MPPGKTLPEEESHRKSQELELERQIFIAVVHAFFFFSWGVVDLQYCASLCCTQSDSVRHYIYSFLKYSFLIQFITGYSIQFPMLYIWRREWLPTLVFWPGESHGLCSPWGCKESDTTEWLSLSYIISGKEMATDSTILAWRIPWTEWPGGLQSWGHKESDMTEVT